MGRTLPMPARIPSIVVSTLLSPTSARTTIQKTIRKDLVDPQTARRIACRNHRGQRTRFGDSVTAHVRRVAAAVPPEAQAVAWLHDLFELTAVSRDRLRARGLTAMEDTALALLTRGSEEPYEVYVLRIAGAPGRAGAIARLVKLADLDDHLGHRKIPRGAPAYGWARRRVLDRLELEQSTAVAS